MAERDTCPYTFDGVFPFFFALAHSKSRSDVPNIYSFSVICVSELKNGYLGIS